MKLIILDRDGVINHDSPDFIKSPAEWIPIPGSLEAIARLNQAGYRVVVASNQSGIARELFDMSTLNAIHQKMHARRSWSAPTSTRSSSARTRRSTTATAASRKPACSRRSASASSSA
jgi:histidinol-phosphate phosphatase family protein